MLEGDFVPRSVKFGKRFEISNNNDKIYETIKKQKYKVICINDSSMDIEFNKIKEEFGECFQKLFKEKSSFEVM